MLLEGLPLFGLPGFLAGNPTWAIWHHNVAGIGFAVFFIGAFVLLIWDCARQRNVRTKTIWQFTGLVAVAILMAILGLYIVVPLFLVLCAISIVALSAYTRPMAADE